MTDHSKYESPLRRIIEAVAAEALKAGDKVTLVQETSAPYPNSGRRMAAYYAPPYDSKGYHGTAVNDAAVGQEVDVFECLIADSVPSIDVAQAYTPALFTSSDGKGEGHALFLLRTLTCVHCGRPTVQIPNNSPRRTQNRIEEQMKRANIVKIYPPADPKRGDWNEIICQECFDSGKATFDCAFCGQTRTTDLLERTVHGSEHICKVCHNTLTAAEWDNEMKALDDEHRWDYE